MANRPKVPGWNNVNLNKPEEYSSEFAVDGNRYANVTNVATGQRQLYLVSGLGGTPLTQRSLLTSTTADGTITRGEGYNDFLRVYGKNKLTNAEINNKKQSNAIIKTAATTEEKTTVGGSKEYKSSVGNQSSNPGNPDQQGTTVASLQSSVKDSEDIRKSYPILHYPLNRDSKQDYIKFSMVRYSPRAINSGQSAIESGSTFGNRKNRESLGYVTLPIQPSISDTNLVNWGENPMNAIEAKAAQVSLQMMTGDVEGGTQTATSAVSNNASELKALAGFKLAEAAVGNQGANLLTRATGGIINPNLELLFQGPQLRGFTFNFTLSAREPKEAQVIKQIIRFFKQGMSVKKAQSSLFLMSPNTFNIQYVYGGNGKDHPWINKIKECALQNFSVNYTPAGNYATYLDGSMTQYDLTLTFSELDPIYDDDYKEADSAVGGGQDSSIGY